MRDIKGYMEDLGCRRGLYVIRINGCRVSGVVICVM